MAAKWWCAHAQSRRKKDKEREGMMNDQEAQHLLRSQKKFGGRQEAGHVRQGAAPVGVIRHGKQVKAEEENNGRAEEECNALQICCGGVGALRRSTRTNVEGRRQRHTPPRRVCVGRCPPAACGGMPPRRPGSPPLGGSGGADAEQVRREQEVRRRGQAPVPPGPAPPALRLPHPPHHRLTRGAPERLRGHPRPA